MISPEVTRLAEEKSKPIVFFLRRKVSFWKRVFFFFCSAIHSLRKRVKRNLFRKMKASYLRRYSTFDWSRD